MWATITKPFAWLMLWLYNVTGSYGWAVVIFALAVNLVLAPFMAKSKKSMMRQSRIQPRLTELQKHYGQDPQNQQKLQKEMQKLYQEEGIKPMSGCLWSLIPFPILIALYSVIRQPLTRMMFLAEDAAKALQSFASDAGWVSILAKDNYAEIRVLEALSRHADEVKTAIANGTGGLAGFDFSAFQIMDYSAFGLNMGNVPWDVTRAMFRGAEPVAWAAIGLTLIPLVSAGLSWLSMKVANKTNPTPATTNADQTQSSMKAMELTMPLMSIWICFVMPAAMGLYWIANSIFGMTRDYIFTNIYKKQFAKEDAEKEALRSEREKELERKRLETEKLRAEGKTEQNTNTSKKKLQANEKQKLEERRAAAEREEKAARREKLGIAETEKPASQVGNRRYARGRAYVADRYENPENAAAETEAAALESENGASIDETMVEEVLTENTAAENETAAQE